MSLATHEPAPSQSRADPQGKLLAGPATPPSIARVREEAEQDLEAPSRAILRFSVALESRMETAFHSESNATALLGELESCAAGDDPVAEAARALCLSNADRLGQRYPELAARYESLEARVDPRVRAVKRLMDL